MTGGAGFIGVNLVKFLSSLDRYNVTILDNETTGDCSKLAPYDVTVIRGDITSTDDLERAVDGKDIVVHLAADTRVMDSVENPDFNFNVNVVGSFKLLQTCRKYGVKRVVAASTGGAILGEVEPPVNEEMAAQPMAPYGASKLAMEGYLSAFSGAYGVQSCALRFSNIYGPLSFHKGSVVAEFYRKILRGEDLFVYGDGSQARDFLYIEDLVTGIQKAMESTASGAYQLGSGRPTTVNELLDVIRSVTGKNPTVHYEPFRSGELHRTWCCIDKAKKVFEFDAPTSLEDGLAQTWAWFNEQAST